MNLTIIYAIGFSNGIFFFLRFLSAAVLGSAIATASIVMSFCIVPGMFFLPALMLVIAFGKRRFISNYVMYFLFAALLSGIIYAEKKYIPYVPAMVIGMFILLFFAYFVFRMLKTQISKAGLLFKIRYTYKENDFETMAIADTGNRLFEPYTGRPVIVVDRELYLKIFKDRQEGFLVPYKSVGGEGFLTARTIDKIEYEWEGEKIVNKNVVLADSKGKVAKNGEYEAIFHTDLLKCK